MLTSIPVKIMSLLDVNIFDITVLRSVSRIAVLNRPHIGHPLQRNNLEWLSRKATFPSPVQCNAGSPAHFAILIDDATN